MEIVQTRPDGLFILPQATLQQLAENETLLQYANGLIPRGLELAALAHAGAWTLAGALYQPASPLAPLLTALLVLEAELRGRLDGDMRVLPLPAFLSYHTSLSPARFPLDTLRLPPLNPGGHYLLAITAARTCLAIRIDIHPHLQVAGHVRLAAGSPHRPPVRLLAIEQRLEWQVLTDELIDAAAAAGSQDPAAALTTGEAAHLAEILRSLKGRVKSWKNGGMEDGG